jgi:hypothetical protein
MPLCFSLWLLADIVPSQLCALSTVGVAATGLALGRRERSSLSSSVVSRRRNTISRYTQPPPPATTTDINGPAPAGHLAEDASINGAVLGNLAQTDYGQQVVGDQESVKRALSQRRRERRRRQTYTNPPRQASSDFFSQASGPSARRPSSSWLRRISVISSNTDSPLSSPRPTSSSMRGSITPIIPRADQPSRSPNKLVKRSTSQHSISHRPIGHASRPMSAVLTLRRPATSHQRSADLAYLATLNSNSELHMTPSGLEDLRGLAGSEKDDDDIWRPYFSSAKSEPSEKLSGRLSISIRPRDQPTQLVTPYSAEYPTLMLSTSINPQNAQQISGIENPAYSSLPRLKDPFQMANGTIDGTAKSSISEEQRKPRQSFSFHDMTGGNPKPRVASKTGTSPMNGSAFQTKSRNVSHPLPQRAGNPDQDRSTPPRLRRKRNFTDSSILRRPQTAPQGESSAPKSSQSRDSQVNSAPPAFGGYAPTEITPSYLAGQNNYGSALQSPSNSQGLGSSPPIVRYPRIKRLSLTTSDRASTVIGSDDTRVFTSGDEDETDFQSDSVFDSFRTRVSASSHSGRRGPNLETLFQEIPAAEIMKDKPTTFADLTFPDSSSSHLTPQTSSTVSNLNSVSTPVPISGVRDEEETPTPSARRVSRLTVPSHPSQSPEFQRNRLEVFTLTGEGKEQDVPSSPPSWRVAQTEDGELEMSPRSLPRAEFPRRVSQSDTPVVIRKTSGLGTKASVFDWSETSWTERDTQNPNNRPKTVHGKQGADARDSRGTGRKAPSTVHLRSQSVPVSRDSPPDNDGRQTASKFGTWGLGHKGVSEDWDGDFDFGDSDGHSMDDEGKMSFGDDHRHHMMRVPQAIMESQASVHGQFGHVQELTLLVEELRRLRIQGNMLRIVHGPSSELWKEADGIVNLATLEDDENSFPPLSPTSHLSFDDLEWDPSPAQKTRKRNDTDARRPPLSVWPNTGPNTTPPRRRDSSAKAKSVLETIYQQRESPGPPSFEPCVYAQQKLPFDTQSLRDLVIRAGVVTRALKEVIRRAEGVTATSEPPLPPDPPFRRIFEQST